jgi:hypothetical protein
MNTDRIIFSQIMDFIPKHHFNQCVRRYRGNIDFARLYTFTKSMAFFVTRGNRFLGCQAVSQLGFCVFRP